MDSDFSDMYQSDTVAICDTATLKGVGRNDDVTNTVESDILLSIKKENLVKKISIYLLQLSIDIVVSLLY
jgi:hypothetical protein